MPPSAQPSPQTTSAIATPAPASARQPSLTDSAPPNSSPLLIFSGGVPLAARVHRAEPDLTVRQPAVIVTGSWLTVKEQMADRYAAGLAQRGFTAVTVDFAGFGASGGTPRQFEDPARKIRDIVAVADAVAQLSFVRGGGVGCLAVCASAQYTLAAIARGARIRAFASVAGWYHDLPTITPFYGGAAGVADRLARADRAVEHYLATGEVRTVLAYRAGDETAGMSLELDYYASPGRGNVPTWTNAMAEMSWRPWLTFDGLAAARAVTVPTMLVHGDGCVLPDNVRAVERELLGPVETVWADGAQTDFYDQPAQVELALANAEPHFRATVGGAG